MEFIDVVTIIYYILEILTLVYTIYVCIKHHTTPEVDDEEQTPDSVEQTPNSTPVTNSSQEIEEGNILTYILTSWFNSNQTD